MGAKAAEMIWDLPIKRTYTGDRDRARSVMKIAEAMLYQLRDRVRRGGTQQGWQHNIPLPTGEILDLGVSFNTLYLHIDAPEVAATEEADYRSCLCNCNYAVGIIVDKYRHEETALYYSYDVAVCYNEERYITYSNVLGSDFTPWEIGMPVLLTAYNGFLFDCYNSNFDATGCKPMLDETHDSHTEDWRPTYRIAQVCAINLPQWVTNLYAGY